MWTGEREAWNQCEVRQWRRSSEASYIYIYTSLYQIHLLQYCSRTYIYIWTKKCLRFCLAAALAGWPDVDLSWVDEELANDEDQSEAKDDEDLEEHQEHDASATGDEISA